MWYPQRIPQGPTSGEVFANSRKDATLVAKNWLPLAVPLSNPPLPQPRRSVSPTPSHSTFTSPAKHPQDLKNESEQQPVRETTTKKIQPNPKCSGANFQCSSSTHNPYPSFLSLCAKHLRARQQTQAGTGKWRWCFRLRKHKHGDLESRNAQCVRTRHVGVKVRTRAWRRNLPNLIRNGHEPAHYVRSRRSSSSLCGVKISLWARYAAYTHPFSSLCGVQLELHSAQGGSCTAPQSSAGNLRCRMGNIAAILVGNWFLGEENLGHWKCDTYIESYSATEWSINLVKLWETCF
jgi:hypothetical protein